MEIVKTKNKDIKRVIDDKGIYQRLMLVPSSETWVYLGNNRWKLNDKYQFVGKVDKNELSIVQKVYHDSNKDNTMVKYENDFSKLQKYIKGEIVDYLFDSEKPNIQKVYLAKYDKATKPQIKAAKEKQNKTSNKGQRKKGGGKK